MSEATRKKVNTKALVGLLMAVTLIAVGVQLVHVYAVKNSARAMLVRAEEAQKEGDLDIAIRCYRYYVEYKPGDVEVFSKLAILLADQAKAKHSPFQDLWGILHVLEQAVGKDPENLELLRRLADISLQIGQVSVARGHYTKLTKAFPQEAGGWTNLGRCLAATREYKKAAEAFETALARDPAEVVAAVQLAELLRTRLAQPQRADEVIAQMLRANPQSAQATLEGARYRWKFHSSAEASEGIARALRLAPDDLQTLLAAAEFQLERKEYAEAQKHLDRAKKLFAADDRVERAIITLKAEQGDTQRAIELLLTFLERNRGDLPALLMLVDLQIKTADMPGVRETLAKMRAAHLGRQITDFFEARVLMSEKRWREATTQLERLRTLPKTPPDLLKQIELLLATCYEELGLPDGQVDAYQRVLAIDPGDLLSRLRLASALYQLRRPERALEEYLKLLNAVGLEAFVRDHLLRTSLYQLLAANVLREPPEKRNWGTVEQLVSKVEQAREADPLDAVLLRADLLVKQDKLDQARKLIGELHEKQPDEPRLRAAMAGLVAGQDPEKALALQGGGSSAGKDTVELRIGRTQLAVALGEQRGGQLLRGLEQNADKFSDEQRLRLWQALGAAYYQLGDREQTKRFWRRVLDARPDDRAIRIMMFVAAREAGDEPGMVEAIRGCESALGQASAEWKYCQASRIVWQVRTKQIDRQWLLPAAKYLKQAAVLRPQWQSVPCLDAEIAVMEGRLEDAIADFRRASQLGTLPPAYLGQFVRLLYVRGFYDEAHELTRRLSNLDNSASVKMLVSELDIRLGHVDASLETARAVATGSTNPIDHLWYGQLLSRAAEAHPDRVQRERKRVEAEAAFRRALNLGLMIPDIWRAVIAQSITNGLARDADELLGMAEQYLPPDQVRRVAANASSVLRDFQRTAAASTAVVESRDHAALELSRKLELTETPPAAWLGAVTHLIKNRNRGATEELIRQARLHLPEDQVPLTVAEAYDMLGDFPQAEGQYLAAVALNPRSFAVLAQAARFYTRTDRALEARKHLERLLAVGSDQGGDQPTVTWARRRLATMLAAEGFGGQEHALALLGENAIDGKLGNDDLRLKAMILAARPTRGAQLQALAAFEQIRKQFLPLARDEKLVLAQLYDKLGQWDQCQARMKELVQEDSAGEDSEKTRDLATYIHMLFAHEAPLAEIEPWVTRLEKRSPGTQLAVEARARLLFKQGRVDGAVDALKKLVSQAPRSERDERRRAAARLLEEQGQFPLAEELWKEVAARDPAAKLLLAAFHGRRGRLSEALDDCEAARQRCAATSVLPVAVEVLRGFPGQAGPDHLWRVQAWFDSAQRDSRSDAETLSQVQLQLASFLEIQGKTAELVRLYRDMLARRDMSERTQGMVSGNLAYLLATQRTDVKEALALIEGAIRGLGPSPQLRATRALAMLANGRARDAVAEMKEVVADDPSGVNYFRLALALAAANDLKSASRAMQTAKSRHDLNPRTLPSIERKNYEDLLNKLGVL